MTKPYNEQLALARRWDKAVDFGSPMSAWTPDMLRDRKDDSPNGVKDSDETPAASSPNSTASLPDHQPTTCASYREETQRLARQRAEDIKNGFIAEVLRLLDSGGIDPDSHSRGLLFGVALENLADAFLRGEKTGKAYRHLRRF
jgi:hypothetical protein